jgi:hypothetical protein
MMMDGGMGVGLLGWVLVIALLVTIVFFVVRLLNRPDRDGTPSQERYDKSP